MPDHPVRQLWRRRFVRRLFGAVVVLVVLAALTPAGVRWFVERSPVPVTADHESGRLTARPHAPKAEPLGTGLWRLGLTRFRDGSLYVPATLPRQGSLGLVVWLHGRGGAGERSMKNVIEDAERAGVLIVAPSSRKVTWDVLGKGRRFGPDVAVTDAALAYVFDRFEIDPARITIAGNSDGGSYALALGLRNGDLFSRIVAFVPEYIPAVARTGKPSVFVGHGRRDDMHRVEKTSDVITSQLKAEGYAVRYETFDAGHLLPPEAFRAGMSGI